MYLDSITADFLLLLDIPRSHCLFLWHLRCHRLVFGNLWSRWQVHFVLPCRNLFLFFPGALNIVSSCASSFHCMYHPVLYQLHGFTAYLCLFLHFLLLVYFAAVPRHEVDMSSLKQLAKNRIEMINSIFTTVKNMFYRRKFKATNEIIWRE